MTMITRQRLAEIADNMYTIVGAWEHGDSDPLHALVAELRAASVELSEIPAAPGVPFVPPAQYAAGGASMADTIERLDDALNDVKIDLDAHRAALVAAGWLDANGEPVTPVRGYCDCESYECSGECCGVGNCTCSTEPKVRDDQH